MPQSRSKKQLEGGGRTARMLAEMEAAEAASTAPKPTPAPSAVFIWPGGVADYPDPDTPPKRKEK